MADWAIGIDLGTTHCAMAELGFAAARSGPSGQSARSAAAANASVGQSARSAAAANASVVAIKQLVSRGTLDQSALLPSFLYFGHESEGPLALPWDAERRFAIGAYARARAAESPARVVSSAKSWLCHPSIDRRAGLLPLGAPEDIEKISPVEASFRYLEHLSEAWSALHPAEALPLGSQDVVLAVPASFDAAARELTVEAAYAAGLENVQLLEEPQAALYAWIEAAGETWNRKLQPGDVVLVVDIGGGTSDFSAIAVLEREGSLELHRVAVGDHILLGGDNMDLALAHTLRKKLELDGQKLDRWQMAALAHACRSAKEQLLSDPEATALSVVVPGRGSDLFAGTLRTELRRDEVEQVLIDGFFPDVELSARPASRSRSALTEIGLPYAADPAITRHLAAFLGRQAQALASLPGFGESAALLRPTAVLFNGGVVKANALRARLMNTLNRWLEQASAPPARVLEGEDPDLAVARGAAYYAMVRKGRGLRIRGGTARAYYVGIESPMPAVPGVEPPIAALCVAPFGMEEGSNAELLPHELGLVVGEPVRFRFFGSSVRRNDSAGQTLEHWAEGELEELAPIEITLPAERRRDGDVVPVRLSAQVTAIGTLLLEAVPLAAQARDERWKIELSVRTGDG